MFVLITSFLSFVKNLEWYEDDDQYNWYNIVSHQWECRCQLALDVDSFQQNCEGTGVVACPLDPNKKSQQWRWDGKMLRNRANGLVMDLEQLGGMNIIMAHPTNSESQQFATYEYDSHIYTHLLKNQYPKVIDVHQRPNTLVGTNATYQNMHPANIMNQLFDIRLVPKREKQ
ncbi:hypothetical protein CHUAL_005209 [Chamberlinius hualienensis]